MEPEGSLTYSKEPPTGPYCGPGKSRVNFDIYLFEMHFKIILPSTPRFSEWPLSFRISDQKSKLISDLLHAHYIPRLYYHFLILFVAYLTMLS
jgi:hypothetical protein